MAGKDGSVCELSEWMFHDKVECRSKLIDTLKKCKKKKKRLQLLSSNVLMCDWSVLLRRLSSQFILTHRPHTEFMIGLHLRLSKYPKEGFLLINGSLVADVRLDVGFNKCSLTFSREIFFSPSLSLSLSPVYAKQIRFCFDVIPVHPVRRQPCGPPIKKRPHLSTVFVLIRLGVFKYICHTQGEKKKKTLYLRLISRHNPPSQGRRAHAAGIPFHLWSHFFLSNRLRCV